MTVTKIFFQICVGLFASGTKELVIKLKPKTPLPQTLQCRWVKCKWMKTCTDGVLYNYRHLSINYKREISECFIKLLVTHILTCLFSIFIEPVLVWEVEDWQLWLVPMEITDMFTSLSFESKHHGISWMFFKGKFFDIKQ